MDNNNINSNNEMPNENQNQPQYQSDATQPASGQSYGQQNNQPQYNQQQPQYQFGQPPYQQSYNYQPGNEQKNGGYGMAVASLVLGIFGVLFGCCSVWFINIPAAIAALILGIMSIRNKKAGKGMAIAGIILSSIALVIGILALIGTIILLTNPYLYEEMLSDMFGDEFYDMFKQFERYNNLY
ncbi:MAG: DUF4190 domain-containing protein [Clostridiales bacterium]|nr:DUF4190 domain-containing protein [Clostridiales bacterium]